MRVPAILIAAAAVAVAAIATSSAAQDSARPILRLRPIPLAEGIRDTLNPGGDPKKLLGLDTYKRAKAAGLDLRTWDRDPVVAHHVADGRLFYVFYKTVEEAFADRPYVIQRIKRTERTWAAEDATPVESVTYKVEVSLDQRGRYTVRSPELGLDVPAVPTDEIVTVPPGIPGTRKLTLVRGVGLKGLAQQKDYDQALVAHAGDVIWEVAAGRTNRNVSFTRGLTANVRDDGSLNSLQTRSGFIGGTAEGLRISDPRARVIELYGLPSHQYTDADWWHYGDVGFWFDGLDRVARMYVRAKKF